MKEYSKKREKVYVPRDILDEALHFETQAELKRKERSYTHGHPLSAEEIGRDYEKAGDLRLQAGDVIFAQDDYEQARQYGYLYDEKNTKRIEEKLNNLTKMKLDRLKSQKFKEQLMRQKESNLLNLLKQKSVKAVISILFLASSLFFVALNVTGNAILSTQQESSLWVGLCLFGCGLLFAFSYLKSKK